MQFVTTADGSKTIFNSQIGENYHSKHGALQESRHVFLKSGLEFYLAKSQQPTVEVLEVGFGTGLNFLLTADYCTQHHITLNYTGIEAYPLDDNLIFNTGYEEYVNPHFHQSFLNSYAISQQQLTTLNQYCSLQIAACKLEDFETKKTFDIIYFDAFAAIHQPDMWTTEALATCCKHLKQGGIFVTYAITGNLKRSMKSLGFEIEKAPGAPGKREMLRAVKK
ncbi:MAG: tRNA (5-methylaminomethyl-2-thiouridine)(34)-methyltransferase MnmD [Gloeobacteraceae cyanobacterium ES-bin-316]|nr:tRNA (5-methylaminomethyl-2-thiouridine)(34)-methyltransferase MnmD [Ferruginibacter sp.]